MSENTAGVLAPAKDGVTVQGIFYPFNEKLQFSNDGKTWVERELSGFILGDEKPFRTTGSRTSNWTQCREVPPPPVLSIAEIEAKYGIKVAVPEYTMEATDGPVQETVVETAAEQERPELTEGPAAITEPGTVEEKPKAETKKGNRKETAAADPIID